MSSSDILAQIRFHETEIQRLKDLLKNIQPEEFIAKVLEAGPKHIWIIPNAMVTVLKPILPSSLVIDDTICVDEWECSAKSNDPEFEDAKWRKDLVDSEYAEPYSRWNKNRIHLTVGFQEVDFKTYEREASASAELDFDESEVDCRGFGEAYRVAGTVHVIASVLRHVCVRT